MKLNLLGANRRRSQRRAMRKWRAENPVRAKEIERLSAEKNRESNRLATAKWRERNKEHEKAYRKNYHAENREARNADCRKRYWANPDRARARVVAHYADNREACLERNRAWVKANPLARRAIKRRRYINAGGSTKITQAQFDDIRAMQGGLCFWTGDPLDETTQIDHVVPISRGGKHEMENMVLATRYANLAKRAKMPGEFWNWLWPDYPV